MMCSRSPQPSWMCRGRPAYRNSARKPQRSSPDAPAVDVNQAIANYNATQTALYPQPNTDTLPPNAPAVEYGSKSNTLEGPGNGIVPTSEPIDQTVNDQFGSKSKPVNIQETHQCLHAQVWVDGRGCKNPTPTR
jgi:hypothetical protein